MKHKKTVSPSAIIKIDAFWKWFKKNRIEIENALQNEGNAVIVLKSIRKKIAQISKCVGFVLKTPKMYDRSFFTFIFTVGGQLKKARWAIAFENQAPIMPNWEIQALVQPCEDLEVIKSGNDKPIKNHDFELKTSEMYFDLIDYDIYKRTISIIVYLLNYKYHYDNEYMMQTAHIALIELIGEVAYSKSLSNIQLAEIPNNIDDLTPLYELPQYMLLLKNLNRKIKI